MQCSVFLGRNDFLLVIGCFFVAARLMNQRDHDHHDPAQSGYVRILQSIHDPAAVIAGDTVFEVTSCIF